MPTATWRSVRPGCWPSPSTPSPCPTRCAASTPPSEGELREHGLVVFADRVIFEAQPPMSAELMREVEEQCAGPLPPALRALWERTAGGSLDYDLTLTLHGQQEAISWNELFYRGSDGYRDLQGWIEQQQELEERDRIKLLPIGGFEYCDRIYVVVDPESPDYGAVLAWKMGLPPAWSHALHQDGVALVAPDLEAAFRRLSLKEDPRQPVNRYASGQTFLQEVEGLPGALRERLTEFYVRAVVDWRTPLAKGTLTPELARTALSHALAADDGDLVRQLPGPFDQPLEGSALPVAIAFMRGASQALEALLAAGAPAPPDVLRHAGQPPSAELTRRLLAAGARADGVGKAHLAALGAHDAARLLEADDFPTARQALAERLEGDLAQVRSGKLHHYLGVDGLSLRLRQLREFSG